MSPKVTIDYVSQDELDTAIEGLSAAVEAHRDAIDDVMGSLSDAQVRLSVLEQRLNEHIEDAPQPEPEPPPEPSLVMTTTVKDGDRLSGNVEWLATFEGGEPDHVDFFIDGKMHWAEHYSPWGGTLDTTKLTDGNHIFIVSAWSDLGDEVLDVTVTVDNTVVAPSPSGTPGVYGPAIGTDGKDNRAIGWTSPGREVAHRWYSAGGRMVSYAYNQRYGGGGYSSGNGGRQRLSLVRCGADGLPTGDPISTIEFQPSPQSGSEEIKDPIPWEADVPAGLVAITHENIDADPVANWHSANELWDSNPQPIRQPAFPDNHMAVLTRHEYGPEWSVKADNTPVFDVAFADGHHEGQAYHAIITGKEVTLDGNWQVRERFTPDRDLNVKAVWFRPYEGSGVLYAQIGSVHGTADATAKKWARLPLNVSLRAGVETSVQFEVGSGSLTAMPIRETYGQANPFWGSRQFLEGRAEKQQGDGPWGDLWYGEVCDLQFYLEVEE